ncbi:MAG: peptidoglycan-binding protein [Cyanobacteria bacterium P01_D01_bin.44]
MIRRSTLLFFTCLTAVTFSFERARGVAAEGSQDRVAQGYLLAQASSFPVDPSSAIDTGNSVPDIKPEAATSAVSVGSRGDSVKLIQERLQDRGYYSGPIDGLYGANTQSAVEAFQQDAGFQSTGQVDVPTWQRLRAPDLLAESDSTPAEGSEAEASSATAGDAPAKTGSEGNISNALPNELETPSNAADVVAQAPPEEATEEATQPQSDQASQTTSGSARSSGSVGRLLWPSLALVAALSSFGIGFLLANRDKPSDEDEDAWGQTPSSGATNTPKPISAPVSNGYKAAANTIASTVTTAGERAPRNDTMRLSKLNVMGELIGDLQSNDPGKRRKAIWELGQRGDSSAVNSLVNQMTMADSKEKSLILAALSEIGIRSLKPMNRALAIALQDDNPDVRKNAIRDLTRIYDLVAQISQMLGHATEDEDVEVRQTAQWALEQLNRIRQMPEVRMSIQSLESSAKAPDFLPGEVSN